MQISNPIFIVGTGRCGSTIFHDVLCNHPDLAWLSQIVERYPNKPALNSHIMYCLDFPVISSLYKKYFYPAEPYRFWERHCPGFSRPFRDLIAADVTPRVIHRLHSAIQRTYPEKKRFLAKITGWPRVGFLKKIFPDAKFVHIIRDGRAVVNSVITAPYFDGWAGPENWTRGELNSAQKESWEHSGRSFVILAAIGWENRMNAFELAKNNIEENSLLEFKYEDFCNNPLEIMKQVLEFTQLQLDKKFIKKVENYTLINKNDKWETELNEEQQKQLDEYLKPLLIKYGYI